MNPYDRNTEISPILSVLYIAAILSLTIVALFKITYDNVFTFGYVLSPVYSLGFSIPFWLLILLFVAFTVLSMLIMRRIILCQLGLNKSVGIFCFFLPMFFLSLGKFSLAILLSFQMFMLMVSLLSFSRMAMSVVNLKMVFVLGLVTGLFALVNDTAIILFLSLFFSMLSLRILNTRIVLIYFLSFLMPLAYTAAFLYLFDYSIANLYANKSLINLDFEFMLFQLKDPVAVGFVAIILMSLTKVYAHASEYKISIRRTWDAILSVFLSSAVFLIFANKDNISVFFVFITSVALLFFSKWIVDTKRKFFRLILYLLPLLLYVYLYFFQMK